jgi:hypothetical protein
VSIPGSGDGLLDLVCRDLNRHEEGVMFPISAVVRSSLGVLEITGDDVSLQAMQKSAMKEHSVPRASLRVAGNLEILNRQVADPLESDGWLPSMERLGHAL